MIATRPFLFVLVEIRAKSTDPQIRVPAPIQLLLQICLESAKKTSQILGSLQEQNLLGIN
jgi:hypothetical protein